MKKKFLNVAALLTIMMLASASADVVPALGLYWRLASDPTAGAGQSAPLNQLLIRTDIPEIYYKSGAANTAWTRLGAGGGTVGGSGTAGTVPRWATGTTLGNSSVTDTGTSCTVKDFRGTAVSESVTANTNDWAPVGIATTSIILVSATGAFNITGLTGGADGRKIQLINVGIFNITLVNESAGSTAANRFKLNDAVNQVIIGGRATAIDFVYSGVEARWFQIDNSRIGRLNVGADAAIGTNANVDGNLVMGNSTSGDNHTINGFTLLTNTTTNQSAFRSVFTPVAGTTTDLAATVGTSNGTLNTTAGALSNAGVRGINSTTESAGANVLTNYGVYGETSAGDQRYGVYGTAAGAVGATSYGVYGTSTGGAGTQYSGFFDAGTFRVNNGNAEFAVDVFVNGAAQIGDDSNTTHNLYGHIAVEGTAPSVGSCGAGPAIVGSDSAFKVTTGAGATGCVITFASAYAAAPVCVVSAQDGTARAYTISTTAVTLTAASAAAIYDVHCIGQ